MSMQYVSDIETLEKVWTHFQSLRAVDPDGGLSGRIAHACQAVGVKRRRREVDVLLRTYPLRRFEDEAQFVSFIALLAGDAALRIKLAHQVLEHDGGGRVSVKAFARLLEIFGLSPEEAEAVVVEISGDGSDDLSQQAFLRFLSDDFSAHPKAFRAAPAARISGEVADSVLAEVSVPVARPSPKADPVLADVVTELGGTSPLQMQIGFFRLMQGAAYRCFRASYSANSETHLRAYDLPYTIVNFVAFANHAIDYYEALGVVEAEARQPLEDLRQSINSCFDDLRIRMETWDPDKAGPAMLLAEARADQELSTLDHHRQIVAAALELALAASVLGHRTDMLTAEDLQLHELNRLRQIDDHRELSGHRYGEQGTDPTFIDSWQRVIIDDADTHYAGAIVPTRYWYEDFMPKLLRCCSVRTVADLAAMAAETEADLDDWYEACKNRGEFSPYALDVLESFPHCSRTVKQEIKQAWRLSRHYLNGVQKRREREEFGRETGYLSEYVTFIDIYLGRDDIAAAEMRISFPYFIGPATWRFLHTSAEIAADLPDPEQSRAVGLFKAFFASLATVYPCPYCRFHLNRYVVRNREIHLYPVEYLLLGPQKHATHIDVTIDEKLQTITEAGSLRTFLWKLHNTVSSSIGRTEAWYARDEQAHYTSRYWPSLESELARAGFIGSKTLDADRIRRMYAVIKQAAHLAVVRDELQMALTDAATEALERIMSRADVVIPLAEQAILASRFLHETYRYNPAGDLADPHFSAEEEALARSGYFVEN
ncbi:ERV1/ALR-related protein [Rhizobium sp. FKL33]|uniref:ERV1/ALR-related protein n=1 Tax=Rhizobium sp. FKL33 TaxID=2562307 RepID=UPI0019818CAB|nr:ERV1/ALR-related protein [Rhizobium sp. FKL33]